MTTRRRKNRHNTKARNEIKKQDLWSGRRCAESVYVKLGTGKHKWQRQLCGRLLPCPLHGGRRRRR